MIRSGRAALTTSTRWSITDSTALPTTWQRSKGDGVSCELLPTGTMSKPPSASVSNQRPERIYRVHAAPPAPVQELRDVQPPLTHLALVNPRLGPLHPRRQLPLRQPGLVAQPTEQLRDRAVPQGVLTLGHPRSVVAENVDSGSESEHNQPDTSENSRRFLWGSCIWAFVRLPR